MNIKTSLMVCLCFAATAACVTTQPEDPARRAAFEGKFNNTRPGQYPDQGAFTAPPAWKVGQYVVTGTTEKGKKMSVQRMAVVGEENGGYIMEMINETPRGETAQQMLVKGIDQVAAGKASPDQLEIVWIRVRDEHGKVEKIEGQMMGIMAMPLRNTLKQLFQTQSLSATPGGSITVPAGTFAGTTKTLSEVKLMGLTFKTTIFSHPAVPINGMVQSIGDHGNTITELLEFGLSGAKPTF